MLQKTIGHFLFFCYLYDLELRLSMLTEDPGIVVKAKFAHVTEIERV